MRVLVTGGAGFIGSRVVAALTADGDDVVVLDSLRADVHGPHPVPDVPSGARLVRADLRDAAAVTGALTGVEAVAHLAGKVGLGVSLDDVDDYVASNDLGTAVLLRALGAAGVPRLAYASSMVVYGEGAYRCPDHGELARVRRTLEQLRERRWEPRCPHCGRDVEPVPVSEDRPLWPSSVYGITKRDQEELGLVLGEAYGLEVVALRYLGIYGPRQALGNPYTGVAAIFAARVLSGRSPLVFEDGAQIRDLVHVADVVRATLAALDAPAAPGLAINVATGRRVAIGELARLVADALGSDLTPEVTGEFRAGDIRHCFADVTRAREVLGFEAERTLADGLPELAEWVSRQTVRERGDEAVAGLRARGLVG